MPKLCLKTTIVTNPYNLYAVSFLCVLCAFSLGWSELYSTLGNNLLFFLLITSLVSLVFAQDKSVKKRCVFRPIPVGRNNKKGLFVILLGTVAQFAAAGGIPAVTIVFGGIGNYKDFVGIPIVGPFISYFNVVWSIYLFYQYQSNRDNKQLLRYFLFSLVPFLLMFNRGALMQILCPCFFIYLMRLQNLYLKTIIKMVLGVFLFLLAFGAIGNMRDSAGMEDEMPTVLRLGGASEEFIDSKIPKALFWGYVYAASPVANLQSAINDSKPDVSADNFINTMIESCMPDVISNRLNAFMHIEGPSSSTYLVSSVFNASSVYYLPYIRLGWLGMTIMYFFMIFMIKLYTVIVPRTSTWFLIGWSFLLFIILLNTFNNMWYYSGLTILIMIMLFAVVEKKKVKNNGK